MKAHLQRRINALQVEMQQAGLDMILFADRENLIYYTDALCIECMAMIIPVTGEPTLCCLWLDTPYVREVSGATHLISYHFPASNIGATLVEALRGYGIEAPAVGFHKYFVEFSVFDTLRTAFPLMSWHPAMALTYKVRAIKDETELQRMRCACRSLEAGMHAAVDFVRPGVTELEVLAEADYAMRKAGSDGASFRMQVLNWPKQLLAHPYAGHDTIVNNQPVVIHLGSSYEGYTAKMCRTVFLGDVPDETRHIYQVLVTAQDLAVRHCCGGAVVSEVFDTVHSYIASQGYGQQFLDHLGYGMGIRQSEFYPIVGKGLPHVLAENMVVDLLLPTIYKPNAGGPRVTDVVQVTREGGMFMTKFSREIIEKY